MRQEIPVSHQTPDPARSAVPAQPDAAVTRWLRRTLAVEPPRAKSLIATVWGDALAPHGGAVWLTGLIRLVAPFGINERLVRTSVFRLARDGWLEGAAHGRVIRYRLTKSGARRFDEAHLRIYRRPEESWSGIWEVVFADHLPHARRATLRDELAWAGYGNLGAATFLRPLLDGRALPAIVDAPGISGHLVLASMQDLPGRRPLAATVGRAWDLVALATDYRRFLQRFGGAIERFRGRADGQHDPQQAFVVRTLLIHAYRRVLLRDPLLPAALLPLDWPGAAAYALCRDFYRLTHKSAERHLMATLAQPRQKIPAANAAFHARFGGLED